MGFSKMTTPSALAQDSVEKNSMAGRYSHPDCGSEANGTPANWFGSHVGMCAEARALPRKHHRGSQKGRRSTCWVLSREPSQKSWRTMAGPRTMSAGPATRAAHRIQGADHRASAGLDSGTDWPAMITLPE